MLGVNGQAGSAGFCARCVIPRDPRIVTGELGQRGPEVFLVLVISLQPAANPRLFLTDRGDGIPCGSRVPRLVILTAL